MSEIKGNYINGKWYFDEELKIVNINNPATYSQTVGQVQFSNKKLTKKAIKASRDASSQWRQVSIKKRVELARTLVKLLLLKSRKLERIITSENGKTLKEANSEVKASVAESKFHIDFIEANQVEIVGKTQIRYEPLGVVVTITPWNFPLATIMRKIIPAIVCGNTVIVKPSEHTPLTAIALFEIIHEIGFPKGVLNLLIGDGSEIGEVLVKADDVRAISFTGSTYTGQKIKNLLRGRDVRFQAEMGGSNAVVVMNDANLETAIPAIISNGFACCGQWCTGTSRVIVEDNIHDEVVKRLVQATSRISYGNGKESGIEMGPLANRGQFDKINRIIDNTLKQGATLSCGGKSDSFESAVGFYVKPTIFTGVTKNMTIAKEEVFGPVLSILKARNLDHAIDLVNSNQYGLSTSIFTNNKNDAEIFVDKIDSGLVHINLPTAYRDYAMPLMGRKNSGMGIPECGRFMLDLFSIPKVIYSA